MKFNKKKFIYLISPTKISKSFYNQLKDVLKQKKVSFFQLRLKRESLRKKIQIGWKIKKICKEFNVKFLINDDVYLTKILNADGCHLGQKDMKIAEARKLIGNKIISELIAVITKPLYMAFIIFLSLPRVTKKVPRIDVKMQAPPIANG